MTLSMEDTAPALASTETIQIERSVVENHYAAIMSELSSNNDEMRELSLHHGLQQEAYHQAENKLHHVEVQLVGES